MQSKIDRLQKQIERCDRHYRESGKYDPEMTMHLINVLTAMQIELVEGVSNR